MNLNIPIRSFKASERTPRFVYVLAFLTVLGMPARGYTGCTPDLEPPPT